MLKIICDTHYLVKMENGQINLYELDYHGYILTSTEGLFATIATITNFLMQFLENNTILSYTLTIFKRLYNFFPNYRRHLEGPIIILFVNILKNYSKIISQCKDKTIFEP